MEERNMSIHRERNIKIIEGLGKKLSEEENI